MKSSQLLAYWSAWRLIATFLISAAIITGCGQSSEDGSYAGVGSGGTGTLVASLSGYVADGYLSNATVFLDRNGNYQWDEGEPTTTTDTTGAYALKTDPANIGKYPIVAHVIKGVTIDRDTNQAVANSYVLSMPKESVSGTANKNFISPISSQLREMLETGKYSSVQHAADVLRTRMGLSAGTDMMADYLAANHTSLHTAAQNMATLMGSQMGQILGTSGSTMTVDVNRYRGMMGNIFSNMSPGMGGTSQTGMSNLTSTMTTLLSAMPPTVAGQPYRNMSSAYRGIMGSMNSNK